MQAMSICVIDQWSKSHFRVKCSGRCHSQSHEKMYGIVLSKFVMNYVLPHGLNDYIDKMT